MGKTPDPEDFDTLERAHAGGMTMSEIIAAFTGRGERLTEATFRKYVQLGLLPRSVRVGRKGKHQGSQGFYPATVVRQIDWIRQLMSQGFTIEEIQREFLFLRGELDVLSRHLERVFAHVNKALGTRDAQLGPDAMTARALDEARAIADELFAKLRAIEQRLSMQARMARAAV